MYSRLFLVTAAGLCFFILLYTNCLPSGGDAVLDDGFIRLEVTESSGIAVSRIVDAGEIKLSSGSIPSFLLTDKAGNEITFIVAGHTKSRASDSGEFGPGDLLNLALEPSSKETFPNVRLSVQFGLYQKYPGTVIGRVNFSGLNSEVLSRVEAFKFFRLDASASLADQSLAPHDFTLFQGPAYSQGKWYTKIELTPDYSAPNELTGSNEQQRELGGLPVVYLWHSRAGLALAHVDTLARVAALPVAVRAAGAAGGAVELSLERRPPYVRANSDGNYTGIPVMIGAFAGDFFEPLRAYGNVIQRGSFRFAPAPAESYEPIWCSWGFGRDVTAGDILRTLTEVKHLGIPWVVMDDGFQQSVGMWELDRAKFPNGDADMRALTDSIHSAGLEAKLWWVPMNVQESDPLYLEHPDWVVLDVNGEPKEDRWWNVFQLCPAHPGVVEHHRRLVRKFIRDWGYDGFKMDGACQNMVAPCYNPAHNHARPEESCEAVAELFRVMQDEALRLKPDAVLEVCPCGVPPSPFKMDSYNQQVTADPLSSDQVRARIKMFHALLGENAAPYGDHVELSTGPDGARGDVESGVDFASTLATGGIIGTKFTALAPDDASRNKRRHEGIRPLWEKWFSLYNSLRLHEAEYVNLYDLANDTPETHVLAHGDTLYYGIFAQDFDGAVELRGLERGRQYALTDYANGDRELGTVDGGPGAVLDCVVRGHLLVRAALMNKP